VAGASVSLGNGTTTLVTSTDGSGNYHFGNVAPGNYTVALQLGAGLAASTPTSYPVDATGGGTVSGGNFGIYQVVAVSNVSGTVFDDANHNGVRDPGEGGVAGASVSLGNGTTTLVTSTDGSGNYHFGNVGPGNYTVTLQLGAGLAASTPTSYPVDATTGGGTVSGGDFGIYQLVVVSNHDGHGIGYWSHGGLTLVTSHNLLSALPGMFLVNGCGHYVAPGTNSALASWLLGARATNMAYMLSAQFAAMSFNVAVGYVGLDSRIHCSLGTITIRDLVQRTLASLIAHPYTPSGSPWRAQQEALKNALDDANNNLNWVLL
jgi:hypothetical protein